MTGISVLIVEDEAMIRTTLRRKLDREGYDCTMAANGAEARALFKRQVWDLVLLDINLPDSSGLELLKEFRDTDAEIPVIMLTGNASVEYVVDAMKNGAYDYITKPFNLEELMISVEKTLEVTRLRREVRAARANFESSYGFDKVIGKSQMMNDVLDVAKTVAQSEAETVLILGESGTGKNLLAQAIHFNSNRAAKPFMNVTCTALTETLLESELFGHERGAFTDARTTKKGLAELAHEGTLFLDEIGDMPLGLQAKLLGFLENRSFRRVGGTRVHQVNVRIIAATNQSMEQLIAEKRFREDLYYRLNVIEITMPPLRKRPEDVPLLAEFFVDSFNRKFKKKVGGFDKSGINALCEYPWPGNVRELRNVIERAMILTKTELLGADDLPLRTRSVRPTANDDLIALPEDGVSLDTVEKELVKQALQRTRGNQTKAAKLLRISRDQLRYRMKQYELFEVGTED